MSFHTILQTANLGDESVHIDDIGDRVLAIWIVMAYITICSLI